MTRLDKALYDAGRREFEKVCSYPDVSRYATDNKCLIVYVLRKPRQKGPLIIALVYSSDADESDTSRLSSGEKMYHV